jgi:hydroxymethylpyrimidine pyrophosphatase-like HAD family hydrolase
VRLLATDVDGTIVGPDLVVSPRTAAAFTAAHRSGVRTVLVTGRPLRWMPEVVRALGWVDALVLANGAVLHGLPAGTLDGTQRLLAHRTIDPDDVVDWAVRVRARAPGVAFGLERPGGFGAEPGYEAPPGTPDLTVGSIPELLAQDPVVVKLLARLPARSRPWTGEFPGDDLLRAARAALGGRVAPVHSDRRKALVEMGPPGVDKATGLAAVADAFGVDRSEVVAFGDMPNDVSMLAWAGTSYAMADGHPEALAAASGTAGACAADGVACAIEDLLTAPAGVAPGEEVVGR